MKDLPEYQKFEQKYEKQNLVIETNIKKIAATTSKLVEIFDKTLDEYCVAPSWNNVSKNFLLNYKNNERINLINDTINDLKIKINYVRDFTEEDNEHEDDVHSNFRSHINKYNNDYLTEYEAKLIFQIKQDNFSSQFLFEPFGGKDTSKYFGHKSFPFSKLTTDLNLGKIYQKITQYCRSNNLDLIFIGYGRNSPSDFFTAYNPSTYSREANTSFRRPVSRYLTLFDRPNILRTFANPPELSVMMGTGISHNLERFFRIFQNKLNNAKNFGGYDDSIILKIQEVISDFESWDSGPGTKKIRKGHFKKNENLYVKMSKLFNELTLIEVNDFKSKNQNIIINHTVFPQSFELDELDVLYENKVLNPNKTLVVFENTNFDPFVIDDMDGSINFSFLNKTKYKIVLGLGGYDISDKYLKKYNKNTNLKFTDFVASDIIPPVFHYFIPILKVLTELSNEFTMFTPSTAYSAKQIREIVLEQMKIDSSTRIERDFNSAISILRRSAYVTKKDFNITEYGITELIAFIESAEISNIDSLVFYHSNNRTVYLLTTDYKFYSTSVVNVDNIELDKENLLSMMTSDKNQQLKNSFRDLQIDINLKEYVDKLIKIKPYVKFLTPEKIKSDNKMDKDYFMANDSMKYLNKDLFDALN